MSKRRVKFISLLAAVLLSFGTAALAAENIKCTVTGDRITVSGTGTEAAVSVLVFPQRETNDNITDSVITDNKHLAFNIKASGGMLSKSFTLPDGFVSGEYKMLCFDGAKTDEVRFIYYSAELDALSQQISAEQDAAAKKELIKNNAGIMGTDENDSELFSKILENYTSLKENYSEIMAVYAVKKDRLADIVRFFGSEYGMDKEKYDALSDGAKQSLSDMLKAAEISDLKAEYNTCFNKAVIKDIKNSEDLLKVLREEKADFGYYDLLSDTDKNSVLRSILNNMPESADKLADEFYRKCTEAYNNSKSSGNTTGGGGGGGGGTGGGSHSSAGSAAGGTVLIDSKNGPAAPKNEETEKEALYDTKSHWAEVYIRELYESGIINGYEDKSFRPDNSVTRAEFASMTVKAMGMNDEKSSAAAFGDVAVSDWFSGYVSILSEKGIVTGDNGYFRPYDEIKREDMAVIIYRMLKYKETELEETKSFADIGTADDYSVSAIEALGGSGILTGDENNNVNPHSSLTRAEAAAVLYRIVHGILQ
mgnify:CR=1 FL=1